MSKSVETEPRLRGRPRDEDAGRLLIEAAKKLLASGGFDALNFETMSQMTGVSRAAIYRRWPAKAHLANEIANGGGGSIPDLGPDVPLKMQLRAFVAQVHAQYARPEVGAASIGLIIAYQRDPQLRDDLHTPLEFETRVELQRLLDRARPYGELRDGVSADIVFDLIVGGILFRLMFSSLPPTTSIIDEITETVLSGIAR